MVMSFGNDNKQQEGVSKWKLLGVLTHPHVIFIG